MSQYTRILCLGDSITFGARARWGRTYPVLLEQRLAENPVPSVCIQAGVNGQTSWQIVERAWDYLGSDEWIRVVVCIMGTNDSKPKARTPINVYLQSWDRLLRLCRLTDTILFACEIPGIDPTSQPEYDGQSVQWIDAANQALRSWAHRNNVPFIDGLYEPFADQPHTLLADGIHPNNVGNDVIAERVFDVIGQPMPYVDDSADWRLAVDEMHASTVVLPMHDNAV